MKGIKNKILTSLIRPYSISKSSNWLNYFDIEFNMFFNQAINTLSVITPYRHCNIFCCYFSK